MKLVIVESPGKLKTLKKFLGKNYKIAASVGHIRDLPKSKFGIDIKNNFKPTYLIIPRAKKIISKLKEEIKNTEEVILSTDPDREGEAIAWHLAESLDLNGKKSYQRIVFYEITKSAIEEALKNPRKIDINLVNSQQARRILDRIVGYKLSPFLWKKVAKGLSAGRVQSVAVRLIVAREKEIENFKPQEYWTIAALLLKGGNSEFEALLVSQDGKNIPKLGIKSKQEAEKIMKDLEGAEYKVKSVEKKEIKKTPLPPFITSTLQREAWARFRWPAKFTMSVAQRLYEKGLTTYHRTDSFNLSELALSAAQNLIIENYGENYWAGFFRKYKTKAKGAQEAHEAIRPAYPDKTPDKLKEKIEKNQQKLYDLIWRRFIASQMKEARFNSTVAGVEAISKPPAPNYLFRASGQVLKFDGFLKVYPIKYEETELPPLETDEILKLIKLIPFQHFTKPPPRYTEATLIKELEKNGVGRPSTYAAILSVIQERNYVIKNKEKKFEPTEMGVLVDEILFNHFPQIVDINFTAQMEESLDEIAENKKEWVNVVKDFYFPFEKNLKEKYEKVEKKEITEKTDKKCPKCGSNMVIRFGKFGKFYACPRFPDCRHTESLQENLLDIECPGCLSKGEKNYLLEKKTKKGKVFYGCSNWPECDFALWNKPVKEKCEKCGSLMVEKNKKTLKCSNQNCFFEKEYGNKNPSEN